jgi:hypothetical protein
MPWKAFVLTVSAAFLGPISGFKRQFGKSAFGEETT